MELQIQIMKYCVSIIVGHGDRHCVSNRPSHSLLMGILNCIVGRRLTYIFDTELNTV